MSVQIIETSDGGFYCRDCHDDVADPYDREFGMFVHARHDTGRCQCCGLTIVAGELVDDDVEIG